MHQALDLGIDEIGDRTRALGDALRSRLDALPGVKTHDLGEVRCAIVTARVDGMAAEDVAAALAAQEINVSTTLGSHTPFDDEVRAVHPLVRLSPHYYTTDDELDRAAQAVGALARRG